jgi:3-hydroxyacyl-CoA dehydrogenase
MIARLSTATVVGAGTMGAQIACLLAGAGARVRLLDLDPDTARAGLDRALKLRPSPVYRAADAERIATGGLDEVADAARGSGWVIEAIIERLEPKRELHDRIEEALADRAAEQWPLVSTNTSGIPIASLAEGRSDAFQAAFMGTHFFNPPRYARLLELIPLDTTDPGRVAWIEDYGSRLLGKGTVIAKDRPAFIANRLGVHGLMTALALAQELGLGVDEVDELTGPLIGRPRSATFRTLDLVGLDVAADVADHNHEALADDPGRDAFVVPPVMRELIEAGALGEKSGAGFFRRDGGEILAYDLETHEYRPRRKVRSAAVEMARGEPDLRARLALLVSGEDAAGEFLRRLIASGLDYAARVGPEVADSAAAVDRAMRWGFTWELGPYQTAEALRAAGREAPEVPFPDAGEPEPPRPGALDVAALRASQDGGLPRNSAGSLVELPDGILALELHAKLNLIGEDTLSMLDRALALAAERYDGLVIGTSVADLSAGANLALMLMEAEEGEWDELDRIVRRFQGAMRAIRYSAVPVVVAPRGRVLGGGAEICLAAARRQALAETYIGLVETGVGLIPAGAGTAALARVAAERAADLPNDHFSFFRNALENTALARVSTSAAEAFDLGLLQPGDLVTADPDRQWADAARQARALAETGYRPPAERPIPVLGRRGVAAAGSLTFNQLAGHQLSEHDRTVVMELARVMAGGDVAEGTPVSEGYLLDLEREAFLRLLGMPLTRDRIRHTLKTGKPLRN